MLAGRSPTRPPSTLLGGRDVRRRVGVPLGSAGCSTSEWLASSLTGHARRPPGRRDRAARRTPPAHPRRGARGRGACRSTSSPTSSRSPTGCGSRTAAPRSSSRASSTPSRARARRTAPSARSRPATPPTSTCTRSSSSTRCSTPPGATRAAGATQFCIVVAVRGPSERMLTRVIEAVDAVHARDRPRGRVLTRAPHRGAGRATRGGGRQALQPQPRGTARAVPVDRDHPHLRRPGRDRTPRHRRGHGAVLRRHPRHGRDARAARRLRVRARRARPVRGADQLPAPHRHPARRPAAHHAARGAAGDRAVPPRAARARGCASPVVASTCSASSRRWACSRAPTR